MMEELQLSEKVRFVVNRAMELSREHEYIENQIKELEKMIEALKLSGGTALRVLKITANYHDNPPHLEPEFIISRDKPSISRDKSRNDEILQKEIESIRQFMGLLMLHYEDRIIQIVKEYAALEINSDNVKQD